MLYSSWNNLLLHEIYVSCNRVAGITDSLISCYHQTAGSPPAVGIWLTDNKSSRLAITLSHSALAAAHPRTLAFIISVPLSLSRSPLSIFLLYLPDLLLSTFNLFLLPGVCLVIIFQSYLPIYLEI